MAKPKVKVSAVGYTYYDPDLPPEVAITLEAGGLYASVSLTPEQAEALRKDLKQAIKDAQA